MKIRHLCLAAITAFSTQFAVAGQWGGVQYEVTITNITKGQTFTPQLVTTHQKQAKIFSLGEPASAELEQLAEGGAIDPLAASLASVSTDTQSNNALLGPGESVSLKLKAYSPRHERISLAAMLIPTNDTFVALNAVKLPYWGTRTVFAKAYDAGTEANDQNCANIPGPVCQGEPGSAPADSDEGFVYISNGFHDLGDYDDQGNMILSPAMYDWRDAVAKVTIKRIY